MALKQAHLLLSGASQAAPYLPVYTPPDLNVGEVVAPDGDRDCSADQPAASALRRTRIWDFGSNLHCSIVGTCLSTGELRHVLEKVKVSGAADASDHDVHCLGVMLAGRREQGAKFLQKALDRRHHSAIVRYSRVKEPASLLELWDESLSQGDIPGAYWAVLTHPAATKDVVKRAFADVHMLSHLVGAANRADIRRLRQLEADNTALAAKVERQQRQLRDGFAERDRIIREQKDLLAKQASTSSEYSPVRADRVANDQLESPVHDLNRQLAQEMMRRERAEQHLAEASNALIETEQQLRESRTECESYRQELDEIESQLEGLFRPNSGGTAEPVTLSGLTLLYVGGRAHQIPQLKALTERAGGRFLHHDGGIEHSPGLIAGLISRADRVLFPIDCVSHHAVATVKRHCRLTGKAYEPLRTASLACLLSALARMTACRETVAAE